MEKGWGGEKVREGEGEGEGEGERRGACSMGSGGIDAPAPGTVFCRDNLSVKVIHGPELQ